MTNTISCWKNGKACVPCGVASVKTSVCCLWVCLLHTSSGGFIQAVSGIQHPYYVAAELLRGYGIEPVLGN